jgi:hypothetical protein
MGAAKADLGEDAVRLGDEIAVGEEQRLDEPAWIGLAFARAGSGNSGRSGPGARSWRSLKYVSHADLFALACWREQD